MLLLGQVRIEQNLRLLLWLSGEMAVSTLKLVPVRDELYSQALFDLLLLQQPVRDVKNPALKVFLLQATVPLEIDAENNRQGSQFGAGCCCCHL